MSRASADLVWRSQPARHEPRRTALVLLVIAAVATACAWAGHSIYWGVFGALVLTFSLEGFLFPCRYLMGEGGVVAQRIFSRSERPWSSFRRVYRDRHGLTLSPYARRTVLEPYRSLRILFHGGDSEQIEARVRAALDPEVEWIEVPAR